jgi:hypothetical protein
MMDEITMFAAIKPAPPAETGPVRQQARARLDAALQGPPRAGRRHGASRRPGELRRLGSGRRPGGLDRFRFRRPVLLAGAAAVAACAAIVVPAVLPAGGGGSLVTAAWAVQRNADGTITVTLKDVFDLGGLQQALASDGVPARVITVTTNPATYTGPLAAVNPVNRTTVSGCFYPATGSDFEPASVQQAVVTQVAPAGTDITALYDIHPAAMPAGSVLLIQGPVIGGQGPRAAADVSELASFPAPAVLAGNSLPPSCTWRVIARFPFRLIPRQGATT